MSTSKTKIPMIGKLALSSKLTKIVSKLEQKVGLPNTMK
jgi:hypothetical protein